MRDLANQTYPFSLSACDAQRMSTSNLNNNVNWFFGGKTTTPTWTIKPRYLRIILVWLYITTLQDNISGHPPLFLCRFSRTGRWLRSARLQVSRGDWCGSRAWRTSCCLFTGRVGLCTGHIEGQPAPTPRAECYGVLAGVALNLENNGEMLDHGHWEFSGKGTGIVGWGSFRRKHGSTGGD